MFARTKARLYKLPLLLVALFSSAFLVSCGTDFDEPITPEGVCPSQADLFEAENRISEIKEESVYSYTYLRESDYVRLAGRFDIDCTLSMIYGNSAKEREWRVTHGDVDGTGFYSVDILQSEFNGHCRNLGPDTPLTSVQNIQMHESVVDSILLGIYSRYPGQIFDGLICEDGALIVPSLRQDFKQTENFRTYAEEAFRMDEKKAVDMGVDYP